MPKANLREAVSGFGHENVRATHKTTLEITQEKKLSKEGDCIITVEADKTFASLSNEFKEKLRKPNARLTLLIEADGIVDQVAAYGSPRLILSHPTDMVVRKSEFICDRTLAVRADKAANDLSRELVNKLKNPKQRTKITLTVSF